MIRAVIALSSGALALFAGAAPAAAQPRWLTMTCPVTLRGFPADPITYRVEASRLVSLNGPSGRTVTLSSSLRRIPLDRVREQNGAISYSSASHRLNGPILTRRVFWTNAGGRVTRSFTETYNFRTKTIRDLTGEVQHCR